ncbi:MAG: hypothetical protein ACXQS8_06760 [Candidatus Helarchaeales archaeon]
MPSLKKSFKLDEAGNIEMDKDGKIKWVEEKENFAQVIKNILLTIKGEDLISPWFGNNFIQMIASSRLANPEVYLEMSIRSALLPENEPRIKEIEELYIERIDDRSFKVRLTVRSIYDDRTSIESRLML